MKTILVIDKQESCTSCMLSIYNKKWFCLATNEDIDLTDRYHIPKWCPLKPLPQLKNNSDEWLGDVWAEGYEAGWNKCLKEIEE